MRYVPPDWLKEQLEYLESHRVLILHKHGPFSFSVKEADSDQVLRIPVAEPFLSARGLTARDLSDAVSRKEAALLLASRSSSSSFLPHIVPPKSCPESDCPICYSALDQFSVSCSVCGNFVHASCLQAWGNASAAVAGPSCPLCRGKGWSDWADICRRAKEARLFVFMKKTPWPGTQCRQCGMRPIRGILTQSLVSKIDQFCEDCHATSEYSCQRNVHLLKLKRRPIKVDDPEIVPLIEAAVASGFVLDKMLGWKFLIKKFGPDKKPAPAATSQFPLNSSKPPPLALVGSSLAVLPGLRKK